MNRLEEATDILAALGLPTAQQNERSAFTLLALAQLSPEGSWAKIERPMLRTVDIMDFMRKAYKKNYAANSRETIRRQTLHQFEQARLVNRNPDDPSRPTNSGLNCYQLTEEAFAVLQTYERKNAFKKSVAAFLRKVGALREAYAGRRESLKVPLKLPTGAVVHLSPGRHNELQVAIVEQFGPRFAPGAEVLYIGDTAEKHVICETERLRELKIAVTEHDKLPDIILYWPQRNWAFLIEAVTSHGPVSPKRHIEIEVMLRECTAERVYVTAFQDFGDFKKYAGDIAWETEVWIANAPEHMIHFNGPKFLGPYKPASE